MSEQKKERSAYERLTTKERLWVDYVLSNGLNKTGASRDLGYKAPERHAMRMSRNVRVQAAIREQMKESAMDADECLFRLGEQGRGTADHFLSFETVQETTRVWVPVQEAIIRLREQIEEEEEVAARLELSGKALEEHKGHVADIEARIVRLEVKAERDPGYMVQVDGPLVERTYSRFDLARMREAGKLHLVKSVKEGRDGTKVELYDAQDALKAIGQAHGLFGAKGTPDDPIHVKHNLGWTDD